MTEHDIPVQDTDFRLEKLDDELFLHHPAKSKSIYLNESASLVWELCDGERTVAEITNLIQQSFPEAKGGISSQVGATLEAFLEHGAIKFR